MTHAYHNHLRPVRPVRTIDGVIGVFWDAQLNHFEAYSVEFPGCVGTGQNEHDALRALRQSIIDYLALEDRGYRDPGATLNELVPDRH